SSKVFLVLFVHKENSTLPGQKRQNEEIKNKKGDVCIPFWLSLYHTFGFCDGQGAVVFYYEEV
ncbi:hypothetical protein, partial [uncultured Rikenella sp.]|uniref:hypothetical protein n=1 Tax=uncultured Rikenella sp. TaxID=368003 RepID=UPI00263A306D